MLDLDFALTLVKKDTRNLKRVCEYGMHQQETLAYLTTIKFARGRNDSTCRNLGILAGTSFIANQV